MQILAKWPRGLQSRSQSPRYPCPAERDFVPVPLHKGNAGSGNEIARFSEGQIFKAIISGIGKKNWGITRVKPLFLGVVEWGHGDMQTKGHFLAP